MLAQAMQECLSLFFPDRTEDVTKWDYYKEPVVPTQSLFEYDTFLPNVFFIKFKYLAFLLSILDL